MFCSKYLRGRAWSLASHQMFFAEGSAGPRPADIGRERTRAGLEPWADHTGSSACAASAAARPRCTRPPVADRHRAHHAAWRCRNEGEGPWRRLAAQKCRLPSRKIGSSSAEFSSTHCSRRNSDLAKSSTYAWEPAKIALLLFKLSLEPGRASGDPVQTERSSGSLPGVGLQQSQLRGAALGAAERVARHCHPL